jgi:hypothetical protein
MKPEKELIWSFLLMQSDYAGGFLRKKIGCKKDFERLVEAPEKDNTFFEWFNHLIEEGIVYPSGEIEVGMGKKVQGYRVDFDLLLEKTRKNKFYHLIWKFFDDRALIGASR